MKTLEKGNLRIVREKELLIDNLKLTYTLYSNSIRSGDENVYSIEVNCISNIGNDSAFIFDITRTKTRADEIFRIISENSVTPCTLTEVLEEIL